MNRTRPPAPAAAPSKLPLPEFRKVTVIAQDPSVRAPGSKRDILMATLSIPAEELSEGPTGHRIHVVDYDSTTQRYVAAHRVPASQEEEPETWRRGDPGIVDDLRFHAQNVYALVMKTLSRFEHALGRRVGWSFDNHQLKVAPHGMLDADAFYSHDDEGLVFGYFPGRRGKPIYACLSHDVVVHETTHALIDALRERYLDPSSADQAAFHEGLADVVALLSVFSQRELLAQLLRPKGVPLSKVALLSKRDVEEEALRRSALFGLAEEMGEEIQGVRGRALRHSTDLPKDPDLGKQPEFLEPHRRGELLVAAVMNGFIAAWAARIDGLGIPGQAEFPVLRVAEEGADLADELVTMWIRALDYMPPVHIEFPDALSAALTADLEARPDDSRFRMREHMRRSFKDYGILPAKGSDPVEGTWQRFTCELRYDRVRAESMRTDEDEVFRFLWDNRGPDRLDLADGVYTQVYSVRPCTRVGQDGFTLRETVVEYRQVAALTTAELRERGIVAPPAYLDELRRLQRLARRTKERADDEVPRNGDAARGEEDDLKATTPLQGGGVLLFDEYGRLKYHVHNDVFGRKQSARLAYLWETGQLQATGKQAQIRAARLSTIHRSRALDTRRFPAQGW